MDDKVLVVEDERSLREADEVIVSLYDTVVGISPDALLRIFERF